MNPFNHTPRPPPHATAGNGPANGPRVGGGAPGAPPPPAAGSLAALAGVNAMNANFVPLHGHGPVAQHPHLPTRPRPNIIQAPPPVLPHHHPHMHPHPMPPAGLQRTHSMPSPSMQHPHPPAMQRPPMYQQQPQQTGLQRTFSMPPAPHSMQHSQQQQQHPLGRPGTAPPPHHGPAAPPPSMPPSAASPHFPPSRSGPVAPAAFPPPAQQQPPPAPPPAAPAAAPAPAPPTAASPAATPKRALPWADSGPTSAKRPAASPSVGPRKVFRRDAPPAAPAPTPATASLNLTVERLLQSTTAAAIAAKADGGGGGKGKKKRGDGKVQTKIDFSGAKPKDEPSSATPASASTPSSSTDTAAKPAGRTYTMMGVEVRFPFDAYPSQLSMMSKIIAALRAGSNALLESPTGSGKSLALLCATLAWRDAEVGRRRTAYEAEMAEYHVKVKAWSERMAKVRKENGAGAAKASAAAARAARGHVKVELESGSDWSSDDDFLPEAKPKPPPRFAKDSDTAKRDIRAALHPVAPVVPALAAAAAAKKEPGTTAADPAAPAPAAAEDDDPYSPPKRPELVPVPRIYFGSRTHRQLAQVVQELRGNATYRPRMAVLGSRNQYCVDKDVQRAANRNDACAAAVDSKSCRYFEGARALSMSRRLPAIWDVEDMRDLGLKSRGCPYFASRTLAETADLILCPYNYLLDPQIRASMGIKLDNAIVVLDEAHNVEDVAREAAGSEIEDIQLAALAKELADLIKFFGEMDEGDVIAHYVSGVPDYAVLLRLVEALQAFLADHVKSFQEVTFDHKLNVVNPDTFVRHLGTSGVTLDTLVDVQAALETVSACKADQRENSMVQVISDPAFRLLGSLLLSLGNLFDPRFTADFHVIAVERIVRANTGKTNGRSTGAGSRRSNNSTIADCTFPCFIMSPDSELTCDMREEWKHKMALWCMNPGVTFSALGKQAHSVLLTSGTLSPMGTFASELQADFPIRLEADHVIQLDQTWVGAVNSPELIGTYQQSETLEYQDAIGWAVVELARHVPHGMLVFAPSYAFLDKLINRWRLTGAYDALERVKKVFTEPRAGKEAAFEDAINGFYEAVEESSQRERDVGHWLGGGALMFGVYRGKVSEGIDFSNNRARAVVCIGIPYPSVMDKKVQLKKAYNDRHRYARRLLSGSEWYDIQAYRAINQALGRCIRHRNDWGALVLLDRRFATPKAQQGLSKWVRPRITVWNHLGAALENVVGFLEYRGVKYAPPQPPPGSEARIEEVQEGDADASDGGSDEGGFMPAQP
ncbi:hypothetical protein H9P43_009168 [Blastocladiella emersonii ATCC 22665]|nr:hypothetical protein H9P43_009168 [Blastocladiella emersonii ATCC 22665]